MVQCMRRSLNFRFSTEGSMLCGSVVPNWTALSCILSDGGQILMPWITTISVSDSADSAIGLLCPGSRLM